VINVLRYLFDILFIISACLSDLLTNDFRLSFQSVLHLFDLALLDVQLIVDVLLLPLFAKDYLLFRVAD
jgi:hypothetical protein